MKKSILMVILWFLLLFQSVWSAPPVNIHDSASVGNIDALKMIIDKGADINKGDSYNGETPLMLASSNGRIEAVKFLLKRRADVNIKSKNNDTALIKAADGSHVEIIRLLLENGADVNCKSKNGKTAFKLAADGDYSDICNLLNKKGAKDNETNCLTLFFVNIRSGIVWVIRFAFGVIVEAPGLIIVVALSFVIMPLLRNMKKSKSSPKSSKDSSKGKGD